MSDVATLPTVTERVEAGLVKARRPEDGLLHCSSDLLGPLRHAMLRITGAPYTPEPIASRIRLMTGTLWHKWIADLFEDERVKVLSEVNISAGLPKGWSGTLDHLFYDPSMDAWRIKDIKTQRAEAFAFDKGIVKSDHQAQLSAYWHGAVAVGFTMVKEIEVIYIPMNAAKTELEVKIDERSCDVLPKEPLWEDMAEKWQLLGRYLEAHTKAHFNRPPTKNPAPESWLLPELSDPPPRVQKLVNRYDGKGQKKVLESIDLKLVPDWRAAFCPYEPPLCTCCEQGETKIGEYLPAGSRWLWKARSGYEHITPTLEPEGGVITF